MSKIKWDEPGAHYYETGVKNGVLYTKTGSTANGGNGYAAGVPWNGLTAVTESPSGAESTALYADDVKYLNLLSAEEFGGTIECYTYPNEFAVCNGEATLKGEENTAFEGITLGQQGRKEFGFVYTTTLGNDEDGNDLGYKIHIVYNALASPSEKPYATINDSPEAITFSYEFSTTPIKVTGHKPTAHLEIDSTKIDGDLLTVIENKLYGTDPVGTSGGTGTPPTLVTPDELVALLKAAG